MKHTPNFVKDFLVSEEIFELRKHPKYKGMLCTYPTPSLEKIPDYYKSDDYISHTNQGEGLLNKIYFWVKQINQRYKKRLISKPAQYNIKTLDYGCGVGDFVEYLNISGYDAYGIEPNPKANLLASEKNSNKIFKNSEFLQANQFDVITLYHVLEHIPNLQDEIERIIHALKPDGELFIAVPNYLSFDAKYYKQYWAAYDVPRHLWHFDQSAIQQIFSEFGMIIESSHPLWFDAFYISLISEKYKKASLRLLIGPLVGLMSNIKAVQSGQFSSIIYKITRK